MLVNVSRGAKPEMKTGSTKAKAKNRWWNTMRAGTISRGKWGDRGRERKTKEVGKVCHYAQHTKLVCLHLDCHRKPGEIAAWMKK